MNLPPILCAIVAFMLAASQLGSARAQALNEPQPEPRGYVVAFGFSDELNVFHSEATRGAAILAQRYGRGVDPIVLTNTRASQAATVGSLREALSRSASRMDRQHDVLFAFLTSHGSPEGVEIKAGKRRSLLTPAQLAGVLRESNVRHKVLIISACYSGIFTPLADPQMLVITAADAAHPSFGCEPTRHLDLFRARLLQPGNAQDRQSARYVRSRALSGPGAGTPARIRAVQSANAGRGQFRGAPPGGA